MNSYIYVFSIIHVRMYIHVLMHKYMYMNVYAYRMRMTGYWHSPIHFPKPPVTQKCWKMIKNRNLIKWPKTTFFIKRILLTTFRSRLFISPRQVLKWNNRADLGTTGRIWLLQTRFWFDGAHFGRQTYDFDFFFWSAEPKFGLPNQNPLCYLVEYFYVFWWWFFVLDDTLPQGGKGTSTLNPEIPCFTEKPRFLHISSIFVKKIEIYF